MAKKNAKSNTKINVGDFIRAIDHATGLLNPRFLWTRAVQMLNGKGDPTYTAQLITESYSEINIAFDVEAGKIWLAAKPRYNVITPSDKVDQIRLKGAQDMAALLKAGKPVPSYGSVLDVLDGPLAEFAGDYAGYEITRGWTSEKYAEAMEETGFMADLDGIFHVGDVNMNTALATTYLPVYVVPILPDEEYEGETPDDAAEIIGAKGFTPSELRALIRGTGKRGTGMVDGLGLAALQLFTMHALDEFEEGDPYYDYAANL